MLQPLHAHGLGLADLLSIAPSLAAQQLVSSLAPVLLASGCGSCVLPASDVGSHLVLLTEFMVLAGQAQQPIVLHPPTDSAVNTLSQAAAVAAAAVQASTSAATALRAYLPHSPPTITALAARAAWLTLIRTSSSHNTHTRIDPIPPAALVFIIGQALLPYPLHMADSSNSNAQSDLPNESSNSSTHTTQPPRAINLHLADWLLQQLSHASSNTQGGASSVHTLERLLPSLLAACFCPSSLCAGCSTCSHSSTHHKSSKRSTHTAEATTAPLACSACATAKVALLQRACPHAQAVLDRLVHCFCSPSAVVGDAQQQLTGSAVETSHTPSTPASLSKRQRIAKQHDEHEKEPAPQHPAVSDLSVTTSSRHADMHSTWDTASPLISLLPSHVVADLAQHLLKAALANHGCSQATHHNQHTVCNQQQQQPHADGNAAVEAGSGSSKKRKKRHSSGGEGVTGDEAIGQQGSGSAQGPVELLLDEVALEVALTVLGEQQHHSHTAHSVHGSGCEVSVLLGISSQAQELVMAAGERALL